VKLRANFQNLYEKGPVEATAYHAFIQTI